MLRTTRNTLMIFALLPLIILLPPAVSSAAEGQKCVIAFPERSGSWTRVDGDQYAGPLIEASEDIFERAGVTPIQHPIERWQHILEKFETGGVDILAAAVRTSAREKSMLFVGPWINYRWGPFYLADNEVSEKQRPKIGVNRALRGVWPVPTYLERLNGEPVWDTPEELIRSLSSREIDILLGEYEATTARAAELGIKVRRMPEADMRLSVYMAVNPKGGCASATERLEKAIREWIQSGGRAALLASVRATAD